MNANKTLLLHNSEQLFAGDLITEREAAEILGISPHTLENWRWNGIGPNFCRVGARMVRYRRTDLADFVQRGGAV